MNRRYEGRGIDIADILPAISLVIALLAAVAALFFYTDSRQYRNSNDLAMARAVARSQQLETQLRSLETQMNDTRTSVQRTVDATASAAVGSAVTREVNKALDANTAIGRTNVSQTWTEPQSYALKGSTGSIAVEGVTAEGRTTVMKWKIGDAVRNQIAPGTVAFGDEVVIGAPGAWDRTVAATMLNVASDMTPSVPANTPVVAIRDHWNGQGILVLGQDGADAPSGKVGQGDWRVGLYTDRLLFGPPGVQDASRLNSGISWIDVGALNQGSSLVEMWLQADGNIVARVNPGYFRLDAPLVLNAFKSAAGDPAGIEGMIYINLADNAVRMFVEGAWRTLASW